MKDGPISCHPDTPSRHNNDLHENRWLAETVFPHKKPIQDRHSKVPIDIEQPAPPRAERTHGIAKDTRI